MMQSISLCIWSKAYLTTPWADAINQTHSMHILKNLEALDNLVWKENKWHTGDNQKQYTHRCFSFKINLHRRPSQRKSSFTSQDRLVHQTKDRVCSKKCLSKCEHLMFRARAESPKTSNLQKVTQPKPFIQNRVHSAINYMARSQKFARYIPSIWKWPSQIKCDRQGGSWALCHHLKVFIHDQAA